jgi:hypothetical protein
MQYLLQWEMLNAPNKALSAHFLSGFSFLHLRFYLFFHVLKNDFYLCVLFVLHVLEMFFLFFVFYLFCMFWILIFFGVFLFLHVLDFFF